MLEAPKLKDNDSVAEPSVDDNSLPADQVKEAVQEGQQSHFPEGPLSPADSIQQVGDKDGENIPI